MDLDAIGEYKQRAFDSFCKKVVKNELRNFYTEVKRQLAHEIPYSELEAQLSARLSEVDDYPIESHNFNVMGYDISIRSDLLAESLAALSERRRVILLLHHCFDLSDREIGELLGMVRQTVQYQRKSTLKQLSEMMKEYEDE